MVGTGAGQSIGNQLLLDYRLRVPAGSRNLTLKFDDRMYLLDDGVVINTNTGRKFGFLVARISFAFRREG